MAPQKAQSFAKYYFFVHLCEIKAIRLLKYV
jgi:hypothetical protein